MHLHPQPFAILALVVTTCCALPCTPAHADIVAGVSVNGALPPPIQAPPHDAGTQSMATQINFDDAVQPCVFLSTSPLRTSYQAQGVVFSGGGPLDGGAILNQCGNFSVTGYSAPNFLAFNPTVVMMNGGVPGSPQHIAFTTPVITVEMKIASGGGGIVTLIALDASLSIVASLSRALSSVAQLLTLTGPDIVQVDVIVEGQVLPNYGWIIDDLAFSTGPTPAQPVSWGSLKTSFLPPSQ